MKHIKAVLTAAVLFGSVVSSGCGNSAVAASASPSASSMAAAAAVTEPAAEPTVSDWYGQYAGTLTATRKTGTAAADESSEQDAVYGVIDTDGADYLEIYFDEVHDMASDPILLSTYVSLGQDTLEVADGDDWLLDQHFTAADQVIASAVKSGTDPLRLTLTGTYHSSDSDEYQWTIELAQTCKAVCSLEEAHENSDGGSGLISFASVGGSSGSIMKNERYTAAVASSSNIVRVRSIAELDSYLDQQKNDIVIFWAEWCSPCQMLLTIRDDLAEDHPDILFIMCNIDEYPDVAAAYKVNSIPAVGFFPEGQMADMEEGIHVKSWYEEKMDIFFN